MSDLDRFNSLADVSERLDSYGPLGVVQTALLLWPDLGGDYDFAEIEGHQ